MKKKLAVSISGILMIGVALVLWISTSLGLKDASADAENTNQKLAASLSVMVRQVLEINNTKARSWVVQATTNEALSKLLDGDSSVFGVQVFDRTKKAVDLSAFQANLEIPAEQNFVEEKEFERVTGKSDLMYRTVTIGKTRMHLMLTPLVVDEGEVKRVLAVFLDPASYASLFKLSDIEEKFMFDSQGEVMMRSPSLSDGFFEGQKMPVEVVALASSLRNSSTGNTQSLVKTTARDAKFFVGVYDTKAGIFVAVTTPQSKIFEKVEKVAWRSTYLGLALLSLALCFAFFFSESIVRPVLSLVEAAQMVSQGDFSVRTLATTRDELAVLSHAFNEMTSGLADREKLKDTFGRLHSKAVFQKLIEEGNVNLGGERIPVTVFFSDIRSFTSSSEKMQPEHVVEMLNEYFTEMVAVIERFGGDVDKYVGDAIMAVWGLAKDDPVRNAERSVIACLVMREKLRDLNFRRRERGQPPIEIGMGLNSGDVLAGKIGSASRMEYTVIGDTVNTASRMESLTKDLKTDFLINESTVALLPRPEILQLEGPFETAVKGKAGMSLVYGCKGLKPEFAHLLDELMASVEQAQQDAA